MIKEIPSLENNLVMVDEYKQVAMVARKICKALQESLVQIPKEDTQKAIVVMNPTSREEIIALGITDRILVLVVGRRMMTKHNVLQNALTTINIIQQWVENFNKLFQPPFQKGFPKFWGPERKVIPQSKYVELLQQEGINHEILRV